jgi:hypothetical protein
MKSLSTLHLSGNGLTGSLPNDIGSDSILADLSLSNNLLTGTLPLLFQSREWFNLDLSYNRITGTLKTDFTNQQGTNRTLILHQNRLSGIIPSTLMGYVNLQLLHGNIFSCDL